jgi:hypothetical protein
MLIKALVQVALQAVAEANIQERGGGGVQCGRVAPPGSVLCTHKPSRSDSSEASGMREILICQCANSLFNSLPESVALISSSNCTWSQARKTPSSQLGHPTDARVTESSRHLTPPLSSERLCLPRANPAGPAGLVSGSIPVTLRLDADHREDSSRKEARRRRALYPQHLAYQRICVFVPDFRQVRR